MRVSGSILTETGDYRFLDGYSEKNKVYLFGFDGVFSFVMEYVINNDSFEGTMYAGKSYNKKVSAKRDENFQLQDPNTLTKITKNDPLILSVKDINGTKIDFSSSGFENKAKIVQVFGSWCPNCIDETNYFIKWRKENAAKLNDIEFIALAFEKFPTEKEALKKLRKLRIKLGMNYPLVLADYSSTKTVTNFFPIEKAIAFPTTFFLNKKNEIVKVHTGFSGQATGETFTSFKDDFNLMVDKLIKEEL